MTCKIDIENAISTCEIRGCRQENAPPAGIADELAKLKKLKDEGALTEEEFQAQKKKLLHQ